MAGESILEKIINQKQAETIGHLHVADIIETLLERLGERERDILKRRFGLNRATKATLEEIGKSHNLTRERVRQIETGSISKLKKLEDLVAVMSDLKMLVTRLLEDHGGLMDREYLFDILSSLALDQSKIKDEDPLIYRNHFNFLLSKIMDAEIAAVEGSANFNPAFKLRYQELDHLEEMTKELLTKVKAAKRLFITEELLSLVRGLDSYNKNEGKLQSKEGLNLVEALRGIIPDEELELANDQKPLYSLLKAIADIEQNKFGHWGHGGSREINPKTINDKIYLVLKNNAKPMHYEEISKKINETGFDGKKVNTATVHNELILDGKYVLVGRGLYALKEWGYTKGTVADVIIDILSKSKQPLSKKEITEEVMKQRMVKKTTIDLALMNKKRFERVTGNKYIAVK
ncbi:MAG: hypothetical protein NTY12_01875 [Candidatus Falkowbacteria bacterium]|nr:hypothetical protein [Candidatus Falkowbacteria bacterium]